MDVGKQIKKFRQDLKLSQEELASKIFVTRQTISNLPKYISNFPYFTGFPACALAKRYVFSLIFALMR